MASSAFMVRDSDFLRMTVMKIFLIKRLSLKSKDDLIETCQWSHHKSLFPMRTSLSNVIFLSEQMSNFSEISCTQPSAEPPAVAGPDISCCWAPLMGGCCGGGGLLRGNCTTTFPGWTGGSGPIWWSRLRPFWKQRCRRPRPLVCRPSCRTAAPGAFLSLTCSPGDISHFSPL